MQVDSWVEPSPGQTLQLGNDSNPWLNDGVLLSLSIWWVKATHPDAPDFSAEVAVTFESLQRDLRGPESGAGRPRLAA